MTRFPRFAPFDPSYLWNSLTSVTLSYKSASHNKILFARFADTPTRVQLTYYITCRNFSNTLVKIEF